jgi:hypothetical protein
LCVDPDGYTVTQSEWVKSLVGNVEDTCHFGDGRPLRGSRYLYQRIPGVEVAGKRNSLRRWAAIRESLRESAVSIDDRVVLDVGCNAGMMLSSALSDGAYWGVGWDLPHVATVAQELLLATGYSRTSIVGAALDPDYPLSADIPAHIRHRINTSVVLYLAVRHHIGLLRELIDLPWAALVYEGPQGERTSELAEVLRPLLDAGALIRSTLMYRDGDSGTRPLAVLTRG